MKYSDKQIKELLDGLFDGSITEHALPEDLYFAIAEYLKKGLYDGFGKTLAMSEDKELRLITELRENIYMFSAAKTYQETKMLSSLLVGDDGQIVSRRDFHAMGELLLGTWNKDYADSEYNTAIAQGTMGAKWLDMEERKELFPLLRYSTIGDACDICGPLDGFTAPMDDPAWDEIYPANHFNCRCTVLQEDDSVQETPKDERDEILEKVTEDMDDVFKNNCGKTGYVFSEDHPYFTSVPKDDRDFAQNNFNLPIPEED